MDRFTRTPLLACATISFLFFSSVVFSAPDSYDEATQERIVTRALTVMERRYLYWDEGNRDVCKKELSGILSAKISSENGHGVADASGREAGAPQVCLDRFSRVMTPREFKELNTRLSGEMSGIGVRLKIDGGHAAVVNVVEGSPAARGGVIPGDVFLKARNEGDSAFFEFTGADADSVIEKIRGQKGSVIYIVVKRNGAAVELPPIARDTIEIPTVTSRLVDNIGYVGVGSWGEKTADEIEDALARITNMGIDSVVIDVRDNPGGSIVGPLEALYYFSSNGEDILFTIRSRDGEDVRTVRNPSGGDCPEDTLCLPFSNPKTGEPKFPGRFKGMKVAVLVNGESASASEIFAGTMREWGEERGSIVVVGAPSFGKGVGQDVMRLPERFAMAITSFEFLVGNRKVPVNGIGVSPDILVDDTRSRENLLNDTGTERDAQFQAAISVLIVMSMQ